MAFPFDPFALIKRYLYYALTCCITFSRSIKIAHPLYQSWTAMLAENGGSTAT